MCSMTASKEKKSQSRAAYDFGDVCLLNDSGMCVSVGGWMSVRHGGGARGEGW